MSRLRRLPVTVGLIALLCASVLYAGLSVVRLHRARANLLAQGRDLVFVPGDLSLRDAPATLNLWSGDLFGDAHYTGNVRWYPPATPLLGALIMRLNGQPVFVGLTLAAIALESGLIFAVGALMLWCFGWVGLVALGLGVALEVFSFVYNPYPIVSVQLPLTLYFIVAGALFVGPNRLARRKMLALFATLGGLQGLLGLWQGSSFVAAAFVSAVLLAYYAIAMARQRRWDWLAPMALCVGVAAAVFGLLVAPQVLFYGRFQQNDIARLYLDRNYANGNDLRSFVRLVNFGAVGTLELPLLIAFLSVFVRSPDPRLRTKATPLLLAWVFASVMAHVGFIENLQRPAWLGALSRTILLAPAHTFQLTAVFVFGLIRLFGVGVILMWLLRLLAKLAAPLARKAWWPRVALLGQCALVVVSVVPLVAEAPSPERNGTSASVDGALLRFAENVSRTAPRDASVLFGERIMAFAPVKPLAVQSGPHENPYARPLRELARDRLTDIDELMAGAQPQLEKTLRDFNVQYAVVRGDDEALVLWLCDGETVFTSTAGLSLRRIGSNCAYPPATTQLDLTGAVTQNTVLLPNGPTGLALGLAPGVTTTGFVDLGLTPVAGRQLIGLNARGDAGGARCLTLGGLFSAPHESGRLVIGRKSYTHVISGTFDVTTWMVAPASANGLIPRIVLDPKCVEPTQTIGLTSISIATRDFK